MFESYIINKGPKPKAYLCMGGAGGEPGGAGGSREEPRGAGGSWELCPGLRCVNARMSIQNLTKIYSKGINSLMPV